MGKIRNNPRKIAEKYKKIKEHLKEIAIFDPIVDDFWVYHFKCRIKHRNGRQDDIYLLDIDYF